MYTISAGEGLTYEQKVQRYWNVSSYWNNRIENALPPPPVGMFIRQLQDEMSQSLNYNILATRYAYLIDEVVRFGQKKYVWLSEVGEGTTKVVKLRPGEEVVIIDSLTEMSREIFDRIVGGPYNQH